MFFISLQTKMFFMYLAMKVMGLWNSTDSVLWESQESKFLEAKRKGREGRSGKTVAHTSDNQSCSISGWERSSYTDKKEIFGHHQLSQSIY